MALPEIVALFALGALSVGTLAAAPLIAIMYLKAWVEFRSILGDRKNKTLIMCVDGKMRPPEEALKFEEGMFSVPAPQAKSWSEVSTRMPS